MDAGIIGGADGPTVIFVSSSVDWILFAGASIVLIGGIIAFFLIRKRNKKEF